MPWSMDTSPHLSHKLRETLGDTAGEELIQLVNKAASDISEVRGDVAELRHEMGVRFDRLEKTMLEVRADLRIEIASTRTDLTDKIGGVKSDLMRWSFVFWVGAVSAIALLANVLDRR